MSFCASWYFQKSMFVCDVNVNELHSLSCSPCSAGRAFSSALDVLWATILQLTGIDFCSSFPQHRRGGGGGKDGGAKKLLRAHYSKRVLPVCWIQCRQIDYDVVQAGGVGWALCRGLIWFLCLIAFLVNRLTPNDPCSGRNAPLTSKHCGLYIYSTNIGIEYFKHGIYSPFFFLFKMQFVS